MAPSPHHSTDNMIKRLAFLLLFLCGIGWALFNFKGLEAQGEFSSIVLDFREDLSAAAFAEDLEQLSSEFKVAPRFNSEFSEADHLVVVEGDARLLRSLQRSDLRQATEYIEPNYIYQTTSAPNDPDFHQQWNFQSINVTEAWKTSQGEGVTVAIIDTGVSQVSDLKNTAFVGGYDFVNDRRQADDDQGHGTHVAGTVAQSTNNNHGVAGIAYKAKIMPLKVLGANGGSTSDIAEAIRFAADHGANVINMSLGGGGFSQAMNEAIAYAHQKGVTVIASAGNANRNAAGFPARYDHVIAVSATGPNGKKASYSNYGAGVDIAAPGGGTSNQQGLNGGILQNTIDPSSGQSVFLHLQGTSMAAPHVAGVAALIHAQGIHDPSQIERILLRSATPVAEDPLNHFGAGQLNAAAAVSLAQTGGSTVATSGTKPTANQNITSGFLSQRWWFSFNGRRLLPKLLMFLTTLLLAGSLHNRLPRRFSGMLWAGMVIGSCGLFLVKCLYFLDAPQWPLRLVGSSMAEWGTVFSGGTALNPLTASALIPFVLMALLLGHPSWKWFALGSGLGMSGALAVYAVFLPNLLWLGASPVARIYLAMNGILCYALVRLAARGD